MKKIIFGFILIFILAIVSFKFSFALFSNAATSQNNTFAAAEFFPGSPGSVVVNEVSPNGNADDEWVELFNKSSSSINVSGWKISDEDSSDTFPAISPIPPGGYAVIVAGDTNVVVPVSAITIQLTSAIGNSLNVNNEGLSLRKPDETVIDALNWGTVTTFFSPSVTGPDPGDTLSRSPNGVDTNTATDWAADSIPSIGVSND